MHRLFLFLLLFLTTIESKQYFIDHNSIEGFSRLLCKIQGFQGPVWTLLHGCWRGWLMSERCLVAEFNAECQHCHQEVRGAQCYHCKEFVIQCAICHVSVKGEDRCCHLVIVFILVIRCEVGLGFISRFQSSFSSLFCTTVSVNSF